MIFSMAIVAGVKLKRIGLFLIVIGLVGIIAIAISPYRQSRIEAYLKPTMNCQEAISWQACQARISVGSGGFLGLGLGQGVQAYGYFPQAANDSIFAIYAEKFGFVGSLILVGVYLIMFERIKRSAERTSDEYARLVAVGILAWLVVESFVNIGGMIGIMPIKGITLPFISYGGTSMVFSGAALGLVFQISKYSSRVQLQDNRGGELDNSASRRRLGRSRYANNYNRH
jgi:cell division protein FtsW